MSPRIRDSLAAIPQRTLELIVHGASLQDVLGALCDGIDALDPDVISSVLLADADGQHLWPAAGRRVPQLIAVLAPDGQALYVNQSTLEYTGLSPDQARGFEFRPRIHHPRTIRFP
jgi:PAS domain-containing protein